MESRKNKQLVYPGGNFVTCHIYYVPLLVSIAIRNKKKLQNVETLHECFDIVPIAHIQYFFSTGNYLKIYLQDKTHYSVISALSPLLKVLPKMSFVQVHTAYIINKTCVHNKLRNIGKIGEATIALTDGTIIPVMKRFVGYNYNEKEEGNIEEKLLKMSTPISSQLWIYPKPGNELLFAKNTCTGKLFRIPLKDLLLIKADTDYIKIIHEGNYSLTDGTPKGPTVMVKCTMDKAIRVLQLYGCVRPHRSFIVKEECISEKSDNGLYLKNKKGELLGEVIPIGRTFKKLELSKSIWGSSLHTLS